MSLPIKLTRPIIFFDLETTGLDPTYDRIIEIGAIKIYPDERKECFNKRINPGMRIPAEIVELTGITNEEAAGCQTLAQAIPEIIAFFDDSDLAGFHVGRFDSKMMAEEFKRAGQDFGLERRHIIDSQVIFHQKEKRDLSAAFLHYCGKILEGAHGAEADTNATYEIFLAQLAKYPDLPRTVEELHVFCRGNQDRFVDSEGKFFWRDGEAAFNFGRFKSQTLRSVSKDHPEYLHWIVSPDRRFSQDVIDICYKAMKGQFPVRKANV